MPPWPFKSLDLNTTPKEKPHPESEKETENTDGSLQETKYLPSKNIQLSEKTETILSSFLRI